MNHFKSFTEREVPYEVLNEFGLTEEMISDLPKSVMQRLLSGRRTPIMAVHIPGDDKNKDNAKPAQISLTRKEDGTVGILMAPIFAVNDLEDFPEEKRDTLRKGLPAFTVIPGEGPCYIQLNTDINQVMTVRTSLVDNNIVNLAARIGLSQEDIDDIRDCRVIEKVIRDDDVALGIDLNERCCLRASKGKYEQWVEEMNARNLPPYTFGIFGCWIADGNNVMSYVYEDDYDDNLRQQQKRVGTQQVAGVRMKMA